VESFVHSSRIDQPLDKVFAWHMREGAFERLKPPWEQFEVTGRSGSIQNNGIVRLRTKIGPLTMNWVVRHAEYIPEKQFKDIQIKGFFPSFGHLHLFERFGSSCILEDRIDYSLPAGRMGRLAARRFVDKNLRKIFDYRHRTISQDLRTHSVINKIRKSEKPLSIAITGSTGFVGSALIPFLTTGGHRVVPLYKSQHPSSSIRTNQGQTLNYFNLDPLNTNQVDAVVNLAGENIFGKWTKEKKKRLTESRINATAALCERLASLNRPPSVLVSVSAIAYYGDRSDEILSEDSQAGTRASPIPSKVPSIDFLSDLCRKWENATHIAVKAGIRVVNLRLGIVLSSSGGLLAKILPVFKLGLGGRIGRGNQYVSWIALEDLLTIVLSMIADETFSGPVNAVSPNPVMNTDFTESLGKALSRPTFVAVPKFLLKLLVGQELTDALLLSSTRVMPSRLIESGYHFRFPYLELALRNTLGKDVEIGPSSRGQFSAYT
jgi:uncharacterized protein (TIGR01777 family)